MRNAKMGRSRPLLLERLEDRTLPSVAPNVIDLSGLQVNTGSYASSDILVQFRNTATTPQSSLPGTTIGQQLGLVPCLYEVDLTNGITVAQALAAYQANASVLTAEPDYSVDTQSIPSNANISQQWALNNTGQTGGTPGADIHALQAWTVTTGSPKVVVAVMDTGIDYDNPDLYDNIWINQAEIPNIPFAPGSGLTGSRLSNLKDVDGDGLITFADLNNLNDQGLGKITDVNQDGVIDGGDIIAPMVTVTINGKLYDTGMGGWSYTGNTQDGDTAHPNDFIGWNFVNNTNNPFDDNDHGTHVAGIIGGTGNDGGTLGVAPQVSLMAVKFLNDSGGGSLADFISALNYSIQHGAKISNNSWSGANNSTLLLDAIEDARNAGQIFVAAAGNSGTNTDVNPVYPSSYNLDNIVSVAASDSDDQFASFSNYGAKTVSLAGRRALSILSTLPGGTCGSWDGTSMAAPMVSGALTLVWAEHPSWSYQQVIAQVENTVDVVPAFEGQDRDGRPSSTPPGRLAISRSSNRRPRRQPIIVPGPHGVGSVWSGPSKFSANAVQVTFNKAINAATFTSRHAVTLTGTERPGNPSSHRVRP